MVEMITNINSVINGYVWGIPMLVLIIGTGIYMTTRLGFFQLTKAKHVTKETAFAIFTKKSVTKTKEKKAISQFQALSTALAATIGTGNIAGVATAIAIGGPGAVFWMWLSAFFGMMTNYSENVLGIYFRKKNVHGEWSGGAMYYLEEGLGRKKGLKVLAKPLAILFSIFCILASFGIGNMTQVNTIADALQSNFSIPTLTTGIVLAILAGLVIIGGIKRIAKVTEKIVPFMAFAYILCALIVFFMNFEQIPYVFSSIFKSAFSFTSIAGGVGGVVVKRAITMGFKRGVFSNEAGLGSSVMVHSASDVKEPVKQGMWGIFEVFFDTIIVCTLTAFVLLSSSTHTVTFEEAVRNITEEGTYFEITDNIVTTEKSMELHLIDDNINQVASVVGDETSIKVPVTFDGKDYFLYLNDAEGTCEDDYIYTNIMSIRGEYSDNGNTTDAEGNKSVNVYIEKVEGVTLVTYALSQKLGNAAGAIVSIAILLFAFSTVLGWSFYGTKSVEYLVGTKATIIYKVIFVLFIVVGATMELSLAWDISDTLNGLMAIPNLIGVLVLSGTVFKITKNYKARKLRGEDIEPMLSAYDDIQEAQAKALKEEEQ